MLNILFEFVGGPNDGRVEQGELGESSDAKRHYLLSQHGRVGQRFPVASDFAVKALSGEASGEGHPVQQHYYIVTERLEDSEVVWVRAEYAPETYGTIGQPDEERATAPRNFDGHLLIASPRMDDDWFSQTVILLLHHTDKQAFGLILNCPTPETVSQLWAEVSEIPCDSQHPIYLGGPEDGPVVVLHTDESCGDEPVVAQVFLADEKESLDWIVHQEGDAVRLFVDSTSWDAGQLEEEIALGDWLVLPATKELVFAEPDRQWQDALREYRRSFYRAIGIKHIPDDPRVN
ncbi:MAG: YqgE/AlgH family protein [Pirellulaceae bacterium]